LVYLIISIILLILLLILFLPLKAVVNFNENKLLLKAKLGGVTVFKFSPDNVRKGEEKSKETSEEKVNEAEKKSQSLSQKIKYYFELSKLATKLAKKYILIEYVEIKIEVGTSDAPSTAISTGVLWGAVYRILGVLGSIMYIKHNNVDIKPSFDETKFSAKGKCIIKSRLVYIIFIAIVIFIKIKSLKGKED